MVAVQGPVRRPSHLHTSSSSSSAWIRLLEACSGFKISHKSCFKLNPMNILKLFSPSSTWTFLVILYFARRSRFNLGQLSAEINVLNEDKFTCITEVEICFGLLFFRTANQELQLYSSRETSAGKWTTHSRVSVLFAITMTSIMAAGDVSDSVLQRIITTFFVTNVIRRQTVISAFSYS
jgi:hypothetical protein